MKNSITDEMIFGLSTEHLALFKENIYVHQDIAEPLIQLITKANEYGIGLEIASAHRTFKRQELIWNEKMSGVRPVLDKHSNPIDMSQLDEETKVKAILNWSAIPGLSRHHFGTDLDVYDQRAAQKNDYQLKLITPEYEAGGIFEKLADFLNEYLNDASCPFFRPYSVKGDGIMPEPWHISFQSIAEKFTKQFNIHKAIEIIRTSDIIGKETICSLFEEQRFSGTSFEELVLKFRNI